MHLQSRLLSAAILAALAVAAPAFAAKSDHPAAGRALGLIDSNKSATHRADADAFSVKDVIVDADGVEHVRFDRSYRGLPVIGGDLVTHADHGKLKSVSQTLKTTGRPDITPQLKADQAIVEAGAAFGTGFRGVPSASLVVYARDVAPTLAYEVVMKGTKADQTPTEMHYFVDAKNGKILDEWDMVHTASSAGTGQTLYLGDVTITTNSITGGYQMVDPSRGNGSTYDAHNVAYTSAAANGTLFTDTDNDWGNNTKTDRASVAADAHYGVATTWDYYNNIHGRSGIFNNGTGVKSYVHVGNGWNNAAWYNNSMVYGDGDGTSWSALVSIDVAGHEMSHGVNAATANLAYSGDSGGLNEGNSDIMGTMVEYYAANASDPGDYLIGEKMIINNPDGTKALRRMFKQNLDGVSFVCYGTRAFTKRNDPHYTSGVTNRFFYLLAEGAVVPAGFGAGTTYNLTSSSLVCDGNTSIVGIGRTKAQAIWYKALTTYMTSTTSFPGARIATLNAARDLYGTGSAEYNAVAAAWTAVLVN